MLEADLWKKLKKVMGNHWRAHRIENSIDDSTPDVMFTIKTGNRRIMGMIELKCQEPNKSDNLNAPHYTQGQRDFATLHETYLLLHSGGNFMLFDWTRSNEILRGQSLDWHKENSLDHSGVITPQFMLKHLLFIDSFFKFNDL